MKKLAFTLAIGFFGFTASAQDKAAATSEPVRSEQNIQKEADALKKRILMVTEKTEANKDNPKLDYEAEKANIAELILKWEKLTGKTWEREKLIDKM